MRKIKDEATGQIVEKKSRFIATLRPVETKEEAEAFIEEMKKKYWDAKHNCSAYILPADEERAEYVHSSDDGEPSGTAGKPMLSVLQGKELTGVACVVTRYFGGVLLGTGGLVRAYQDAVSEALAEAALYEQVAVRALYGNVDYTLWGKLQNYLAANPAIGSDEPVYGEKVSIALRIPEELFNKVQKDLVEMTQGKVSWEVGENSFSLIPVAEK
ncbi:MAG: YigZ family protein [Lachnospiraceae bacterium]|nr:YigZ family protein [Lachnospiraceae bacterium]